MFDNLKNKIQWDRILNDPRTPSYMYEVIKEIMIPYNISANKYLTNKYCIDNVCKYSSMGESASPSVIETISDLNYKFSCIRCSSMPLWYYYAFPDVFLWTLSDSGGEYCNKNLFPLLEGKDLIDNTNCVDKKYVKLFIQHYLLSTKKSLECQVP